jgi:hypothetical protein
MRFFENGLLGPVKTPEPKASMTTQRSGRRYPAKRGGRGPWIDEEEWDDRPKGPSIRRRVFKQLLGFWAVIYPILVVLPLFSTGTATAGATGVGVLAMIVVGSTLFFPWIIGLIVLAVLVAVS